MNLQLRHQDQGGETLFFILKIVLTASSLALAAYSYFYLNKSYFAFICFGLGLFFIFLSQIWPAGPIVVTIDDEGVLDRRLGIGVIPWQDIVDVQVDEINNAFLCLRLKDPDVYVQKFAPAKRAHIQFHQNLGFKMINIEVRSLGANLLRLQQVMRKQIKKQVVS